MPSIELASFKLNRRRCLRLVSGFMASLVAPVLLADRSAPESAMGPARPQGFTALLNEVMGTSPPMKDTGLTLEIPQVAENSALVPVAMGASGPVDGLYLLAEGNPGPLLAEFHFYGSALPQVSLRVKLNQTGPVTALSRSPDGWMRLDRQVKVAVGGCG